MTEIKSHPDIQLTEHINHVVRALWILLDWHSKIIDTPDKRNLMKKIAVLHDLGKINKAFQQYINAPDEYKGDPFEKSHSPLSTLISLVASKLLDWDPLETLIISSCILGHHGKLPTIPARSIFNSAFTGDDLDEFAGGRMDRLLRKQIEDLKLDDLNSICGLDLSIQSLTSSSISSVRRFIRKILFPAFYDLTLDELLDFRINAQLAYSLLLEADKAMLAVTNPDEYFSRSQGRWKSEWVDDFIGRPSDSEVNRYRMLCRSELLTRIDDCIEESIVSLTAPTGLGKTLLSATWALKNLEYIKKQFGFNPKVILVLPFLSIIDQTCQTYESILKKQAIAMDGSWILKSHSLSDRTYSFGLERSVESFFIDTWRSELIVTTYDQFLFSMFSPKARYQMRFHNLCDSLIILDEVQSIPCVLWRLLSGAFNALTRTGNSRILLMSATLPPFISTAVSLIEDYKKYFDSFNRYTFYFNLCPKVQIENFCDNIKNRVPSWLESGERVLITLNTRRCARKVYDAISETIAAHDTGTHTLLLISADLTPRDRLKNISFIKSGNPCIAVTTQCVEAGVDIDMSRVIRDFAPLDSLVQIAGRCNREGLQNGGRPVEVFELVNSNGKSYCDLIYDQIHLSVTRKLVSQFTQIPESTVLTLSNQYFELLSASKNTGQEHLERYARWQEDLSMKELLRGESPEQINFIVTKQDEGLNEEMNNALALDDKWDRRDAWRRLSGRIANITVSVYERPGLNPGDFGVPFQNYWILRDDYYNDATGINVLYQDTDHQEGVIII